MSQRATRLYISILVAAVVCAAETIDFDKANPGKLPAGWTVSMTHAGDPPRWEIVHDDSAPSKPNVFAQLSTDATAGRFPLAVYDRRPLTDGRISVRFRTISGSVDQAAGLIWRYRNAQNYYIARANALENNVVLYKVENGERLALAPKGTPSRTYGVKHSIPKNVWNTLSIDFHGNVFQVSLNGEVLLEVVDSTFMQPGYVGLWTKADSVTHFDDLQIVSGPQRRSP